MTWEQLKIFTLQKMFEIQGDELVEDELTRPYLLSMPQVANEALQLLCTAGRYIRRVFIIEQTPDGQPLDPPPVTGDVQPPDTVTATHDGDTKYDMAVLVPDFYGFWKHYLSTESYDGEATGHRVEGESVLVLPGGLVGRWTVYNNAYPYEITKATQDKAELPLHREIAQLMPLYMASQFYKDDDISLSTIWRNEFEAARQVLMDNARKRDAVSGGGSFVNTTGWW